MRSAQFDGLLADLYALDPHLGGSVAADKIRIKVLTGPAAKKAAQELIVAEEAAKGPSALERLAKGKEKKVALVKKKEKKKK